MKERKGISLVRHHLADSDISPLPEEGTQDLNGKAHIVATKNTNTLFLLQLHILLHRL